MVHKTTNDKSESTKIKNEIPQKTIKRMKRCRLGENIGKDMIMNYYAKFSKNS